MPNIITHTLFADEVLDHLDIKDKFLSRKQLFEVGSNGPDFLFFHNMTPKGYFSKRNLRHLGNLAHSEKINEFYKMAVELCQNEKDEEIRKDMVVYVCGHLCHWALDHITHPYVIYRTGYDKVGIWWHHRFESVIDAIILKVKRGVTIQEYVTGSICDLSLEQARAIIRIYQPIGKKVYGMDYKPSEYLQSLKDWNFLQKVFYDQSGKKFDIVYKIEKLFHMEMSYSGYLVPNTPDDEYDTMNLLHKEWKHPCDDTIVSTESFFDLYDKALKEADIAIHLFLDAVSSSTNIEKLLVFLDDKKYDIGLNKDLPIQFFDVIY